MPSEREVKLAVPEDFSLPELDDVDRGLRTLDRGTHALDATYWDTPSLALYCDHQGLRHRTRDGVDGTWTLKGPSSTDGSALVREETEIAGPPAEVPAELLERVRPVVERERLRPVARVHTDRHTVDIEVDGERRLELADDRVRVVDADGNEARRFREVELEVVGDSIPVMLDALVERIKRRGGRVESTAKYAKALQALGLIE